MSFDERRNVREGISFLEEAVLVSLYGNWLITFIDKLEMNRSHENRFLLMAQTAFLMIYLLSLLMYFISRVGRSRNLWLIHLVMLLAIQGIEIMLGSEKSLLKQLNFSFVGVLFWIMIHWVDEIKKRVLL